MKAVLVTGILFGAGVGFLVGSVLARHNTIPSVEAAYWEFVLFAILAFAPLFAALGAGAGFLGRVVRLEPLPALVGAATALFGALWVNALLPGSEVQFPGLAVNVALPLVGFGIAAAVQSIGARGRLSGPARPAEPARSSRPERAALLTLACAAAVTALCWTPPIPEETRSDPSLFPLPSGRRVALIGLDGATWDIAMPLVRAGRMPVLASLMERGVHGSLGTFAPSASPLIWTTIVTGKDYREHGIAEFTARRAPLVRYGAMEIPEWSGLDKVLRQFPSRIIESRDRRTNALWNIFSEAGWTVGFSRWWASYPAEAVNGYQITDHFDFLLEPYREMGFKYLTASTGIVYPDSLTGRLIPEFALPSEITPADALRFFRADSSDVAGLREMREWEMPSAGAGATTQPNDFYLGAFLLPYLNDVSCTRRTLAMLAQYRPQLVGHYIRGIDDIEHHFWHFMEPEKFPPGSVPPEQLAKFRGLIESYYAFTDSLVGVVVGALEPGTTVVVVSDHGQIASGKIPWSGTHFLADPPPGIFVAAGPGIREGATIDGATVFDVAPSIQHALGFPRGEDQKGRVLESMFTPEFLRANPGRSIASYDRFFHVWKTAAASAGESSVIDDEMQEQLRRLGYVN